MNDYIILWAAMWWLTKIRFERIYKSFWSLERAFKKITRKYLESIWEKDKSIDRFFKLKSELDLWEQKRLLKKHWVKILFIKDEKYPIYLSEIPSPPVFLYIQWNLSIEEQLCLAVVWSRKITSYWKQICNKFVWPLASYFTIVSWFAIWVDILSHKIALENKGTTIWVFWTWLDIVYPSSNNYLKDKMLASWKWALISEFPFWTGPEKQNFPMRNRIIAWISLWCLVVEAKERSWSLITAKMALDYNREVFWPAWSIFESWSYWVNELIKSWEAKLVQNVEDILEEFNLWKIKPSEDGNLICLNKDEIKILSVLWSQWKDFSYISSKTWMPSSKISSIMFGLEIRWNIVDLGMGMWSRVM